MKTKKVYEFHRDEDMRVLMSDIAAYHASKIYRLTEAEAKEKILSFLDEHPVYGERYWRVDIPFRAIFESKKYFFCLKCWHCHNKRSQISYEHNKYAWFHPDEDEKQESTTTPTLFSFLF